MFKTILQKWSSSSLMLYWKACEPEAIKDYYFVPYPNCKIHEIRYMMYQYSTGTFLDTNSVRDYKALMNELAQGIFYIK